MKPSITTLLAIALLLNLQAVVARELIPKESAIHTSLDSDFVAITIETPGTAIPFWSGSSNPTRIITYSVRSSLPTISLVNSLGTDAEHRVTLIPKNILSNRMGAPTPPEKLPLLIGEEEVGWVHLFVDEGAINTHKAIYRFQKKHLANLGNSFLVIAGDPFASRQTINAEQDGAEQPATAPESKSEDKEKPKPESEGRSQ